MVIAEPASVGTPPLGFNQHEIFGSGFKKTIHVGAAKAQIRDPGPVLDPPLFPERFVRKKPSKNTLSFSVYINVNNGGAGKFIIRRNLRTAENDPGLNFFLYFFRQIKGARKVPGKNRKSQDVGGIFDNSPDQG